MKHIIFGTAGHVDHGKTALIKALTNIDCDTHKEEKERGITINLGFSHLQLPSGESIGIVDVPGHKDFIKTMVAGAYGIDAMLLVVAADSGIMPQTLEHLRIIQMLGVERGIVVLNKADLVDEETLELAELEISELLAGTPLEDAQIIPVSSLTGLGIDLLHQAIAELIPNVHEKKSSGQFRIYIDRIFNVKGLGHVVTGSVLDGRVKLGDDLYLLPGKSKKVKIRGIQRHGETVEAVMAGDRAAINLSGLKAEDYTRGMVLSNQTIESTDMLDAWFTMFEPSGFMGIWSQTVFYSGTFESPAKIHMIDQDEIIEGQSALVQIHLAKPTVLVNGDRFILRNSANDLTLGGGILLDVYPLHHKKRTEKVVLALQELLEATLHSDKLINRIKIELNKINAPIFVEQLSEIMNIDVDEIVKTCRDDSSGVFIFSDNDYQGIIKEDKDVYYKKFILNTLDEYHQNNQILDNGLESGDFIGKLKFGNNEAGKLYLEERLSGLVDQNILRKSGKTWALASHEASINAKTQTQLNWLDNYLSDFGMDKPVLSDLEKAAHDQNINKDKLKMMLTYLSKKGNVVFHEGECIHRNILDKCQNILLDKIYHKADGINEKEFRELIDGTKKLAKFLLGIFLAEGLISMPSFYIHITEKGKKEFEKGNS